MKVFPTRLLFFQGHEADLERRTVSGGVALSGEEDLVATDGGGRVFAEFTDAYLDDVRVAQAWRALSALSDGGATPFIVPLGDARHQLLGDVRTPPGGLPWWEESAFAGAQTGATATTAAAQRATIIRITVQFLGGVVRAGQWFSIDHPTKRHRAYRVAEVLAEDAQVVTVAFRPPLREAVAAGQQIEFADPKCTMRVDGDMRSPTTMGYAEGSVRFVEDFRSAYA